MLSVSRIMDTVMELLSAGLGSVFGSAKTGSYGGNYSLLVYDEHDAIMYLGFILVEEDFKHYGYTMYKIVYVERGTGKSDVLGVLHIKLMPRQSKITVWGRIADKDFNYTFSGNNAFSVAVRSIVDTIMYALFKNNGAVSRVLIEKIIKTLMLEDFDSVSLVDGIYLLTTEKNYVDNRITRKYVLEIDFDINLLNYVLRLLGEKGVKNIQKLLDYTVKKQKITIPGVVVEESTDIVVDPDEGVNIDMRMVLRSTASGEKLREARDKRVKKSSGVVLPELIEGVSDIYAEMQSETAQILFPDEVMAKLLEKTI